VFIVNEEVIGCPIIQGKMVARQVRRPMSVDALEVGKVDYSILGGKMFEVVEESRCDEFFVPSVSTQVSQE
jgi:hypothetical protein